MTYEIYETHTIKELVRFYNQTCEAIAKYTNEGPAKVKKFTTKDNAINRVLKIDEELKRVKLQHEVVAKKLKGRKKELYHMILEDEITTVNAVARALNISNRNVSSLVVYLKREDIEIETVRRNNECYIYFK